MFTISLEQKKAYLLNRLKDVERMKNADLAHKFELAIQIGHMLKGNGETFGYQRIGTIGEKLEEAGKLREMITLEQLVNSLSAYLKLELSRDE